MFTEGFQSLCGRMGFPIRLLPTHRSWGPSKITELSIYSFEYIAADLRGLTLHSRLDQIDLALMLGYHDGCVDI